MRNLKRINVAVGQMDEWIRENDFKMSTMLERVKLKELKNEKG